MSSNNDHKLWHLAARWNKCTMCPDLQGRKHVVVGELTTDAQWMVIGEAPGALEDTRGRPFIGDSGLLLRRSFNELGLPLPFITNILACRPPNNRNPDEEEVLNCLPRVEALIHLVNPAVILLVGKIPYRSLIQTTDTISSARGTPVKYEMRWKKKWVSYPAIPVWHPAYILRNRRLEESWKDDIREVKKYL